jgi:hypothetical protein
MKARPISELPRDVDSDRMMFWGWHSLAPEDYADIVPEECEWHIGEWNAYSRYFSADREGFIINVTHFRAFPESPFEGPK